MFRGDLLHYMELGFRFQLWFERPEGGSIPCYLEEADHKMRILAEEKNLEGWPIGDEEKLERALELDLDGSLAVNVTVVKNGANEHFKCQTGLRVDQQRKIVNLLFKPLV